MPSWSDDPSSFALDPNRMWQSEHPLANRSSGGTTNQPTNNAPAGQPTGQISSRPTTASPTVPVDFATNQRRYFQPSELRALLTLLLYFRDTTKKIIMSMGGYGIHEESLRDTEFENWTSLYRNLGPNEKRARSEMHEAYVESMTEESIKLGISTPLSAALCRLGQVLTLLSLQVDHARQLVRLKNGLGPQSTLRKLAWILKQLRAL